MTNYTLGKKKKKGQVWLFLETKAQDHGLCFQSWKISQVFKVELMINRFLSILLK